MVDTAEIVELAGVGEDAIVECRRRGRGRGRRPPQGAGPAAGGELRHRRQGGARLNGVGASQGGAEEVEDYGDSFRIESEASDFVAVRTALVDAGIDYDSAEPEFVPSVEVPLDVEGARRMMRLVDALEDSDDVQNVWVNGDVSDEVAAQLDED